MKLFNSMSRKKEEFVPITPGEVKMYCCGPTVYNYIHVGNARPMILVDVLGDVAGGLQQLHLHLEGGVGELAHELGLGDDLGGHEVEDEQLQRTDVL